MLEFTEQTKTLDELTAEGLVIVDYYATWCGPCKHMLQVLNDNKEEIAQKKVQVIKVDIDARRDLAINAEIRAIPTFALYKDGVLVDKSSGVQDLGEMLSKLGV